MDRTVIHVLNRRRGVTRRLSTVGQLRASNVLTLGINEAVIFQIPGQAGTDEIRIIEQGCELIG